MVEVTPAEFTKLVYDHCDQDKQFGIPHFGEDAEADYAFESFVVMEDGTRHRNIFAVDSISYVAQISRAGEIVGSTTAVKRMTFPPAMDRLLSWRWLVKPSAAELIRLKLYY